MNWLRKNYRWTQLGLCLACLVLWCLPVLTAFDPHPEVDKIVGFDSFGLAYLSTTYNVFVGFMVFSVIMLLALTSLTVFCCVSKKGVYFPIHICILTCIVVSLVSYVLAFFFVLEKAADSSSSFIVFIFFVAVHLVAALNIALFCPNFRKSSSQTKTQSE